MVPVCPPPQSLDATLVQTKVAGLAGNTRMLDVYREPHICD